MPQATCQHCHETISDYPTICPHCQRRILGATAIHFLGQTVTLCLNQCIGENPKLAKKKTSLYLKLCQTFLCDSELALMNVKRLREDMDERTLEAIEDVINSHYQHSENLASILLILSQNPELEPVAKRVNSATRRIDKLLKDWISSEPGGRTINRPD